MSFNSNAFLNQTVEAVLDTKRVPFPEGDHDEMQIVNLKINDGVVSKGDNAGKPWVQLEVKMDCLDPNVKEEMKMTGDAMPALYWKEFLDLDANGNLDVSPGKNVKLGKLRQAAGQNSDEAWSPMDLKGATLGARARHEMNKDNEPYAVCSTVYNPEGEDEAED